MNSLQNSSTPAETSVSFNPYGFVLMCVIGGLCGGALGMVAWKHQQPKTVPLETGTVMLRAIPDPSRGVTCFITNLGGVSCVPDQWFSPAEVKPEQQSRQPAVTERSL